MAPLVKYWDVPTYVRLKLKKVRVKMEAEFKAWIFWDSPNATV